MAPLKPIAVLSSLLCLTRASPLHQRRAEVATFANNVIFVPPSDYTDPRVLYARTAELTLSDNVLLATWENYSPEPPVVYFPVYKSVDHGATWEHISNVTDDVNGWGLRYQPFIYELPVDFGGYRAGTVLAAGNSIPTNLSETKIDVYASTDAGYTWEFVSSVARGGEALPNNGLTPIWEPYIEMYSDQLVVYYSDQRDPDHGQKLVHQATTDLKTWADPVDDVAYAEYTDRPGMTTIAQLPTGDYILTYEWGHDFPAGYSFPVTYRISADPLGFDAAAPVGIVAANTGTTPTGSPYVVWSSSGGGENGTIVVSCGNLGSVFTNTALGAADQWFERQTPQPEAYTRHLRVFAEDPDKLLIMGAGKLPPSTTNEVSLSVVSIEGLLSS